VKTVFGTFEFDNATGELWRDGRRVRLQRQPSRLLELLTGRPGEVVTREEIRQALWGDDTHVDFERSLNFCVAKLRSALRDNAASPRFIETLPTRGYRFIAPVSRAAEGTEKGATEGTEYTNKAATEDSEITGRATEDTDQVLRSVRLRWAVVAVVVSVAAVVGLRIWGPALRTPRVVVVPFHNETGSADLDRVAKGVSDATVARLATAERLPHLLVIGNASDFRFSFKPANMKAMGESLGAQYLLLGQMKKDDRRLRIVAHLIRVSDQTHLWAKTYDSDSLDLIQQASIAEEIAKAVSATLAPSA
jgi:DNA-binding winged helix-turn-helix (wHTH) protein/TolB-like protein